MDRHCTARLAAIADDRPRRVSYGSLATSLAAAAGATSYARSDVPSAVRKALPLGGNGVFNVQPRRCGGLMNPEAERRERIERRLIRGRAERMRVARDQEMRGLPCSGTRRCGLDTRTRRGSRVPSCALASLPNGTWYDDFDRSHSGTSIDGDAERVTRMYRQSSSRRRGCESPCPRSGRRARGQYARRSRGAGRNDRPLAGYIFRGRSTGALGRGVVG